MAQSSSAKLLVPLLATFLFACDRTPMEPRTFADTDTPTTTTTDGARTLGGASLTTSAWDPEANLLPEPTDNRFVDRATAPFALAAGQATGFPVVLVRAGPGPGAVPGNPPVVDNFADALDRVAAGGTIRVFPGTYVVDAVEITKPVTIRAHSGRPLIRNQDQPYSFGIFDLPAGTVTFQGLDFALVPGSRSSVNARFVYPDVVVDGCSFDATGGTTAVEAGFNNTGEGRVLVSNSSFTGGVLGAFGFRGGILEIRSSTFTQQSNRSVNYQSGSVGVVEDNDMSLCGNRGCIFALSGASVDITGNRFAQVPTTGDGFFRHVILFEGDVRGSVINNHFDGCGHGQCFVATFSTVADVVGNTFVIHPDHGTRFAIAVVGVPAGLSRPDFRDHASTVLVTDNIIRASPGSTVGDRNDPDAYALRHAGMLAENAGTIHAYRNTIDNANTGVIANESAGGGPLPAGSIGGTLIGSDNVINLVHVGARIFNGGVADFRSNDFTDYVHPIFEAGRDEPSDLTCNWWGAATGPANVGGPIDPNLYTPWATAPVAGTSATSCSGGA